MSTVTFDPGSALIVESGGRPHATRKSDISVTPGGAVTSSVVLPASGNVKALMGWALCETTGSASAAVRIYDGLNAAGAVFARINLSANESTRDTFTTDGLACTTGELYLEVISGSLEGVIYWR